MTVSLLMLARFLVLAILAVGVAALSNRPVYRSLPGGQGVLTLSLTHSADRKAACRKATRDELAALPPNMRRPDICPRERPPVRVELEIAGREVLARDVPPSGIAGDGPSRIFERFELPTGVHQVTVRLRDRPGTTFTWEASRNIEIGPADHRVIDFRADAGFIFH
jgi:hypothetical protein